MVVGVSCGLAAGCLILVSFFATGLGEGAGAGESSDRTSQIASSATMLAPPTPSHNRQDDFVGDGLRGLVAEEVFLWGG